jgi:WD40 repeat protein
MFKYLVSLLYLLCGLSSVAMAEVEVVTTPLLSFPAAERLVGHTGDVFAVAYSPDGSRIVSGSWDKTLKIWDANSGKLLSSLEAHTDLVSAVVFSPSGHLIYSASYDRTIKVWSSGLGSDTETSPPVSISVRMPRSIYNIGETLSCNLDISASSKTSESYSIYAALVYPPTEGYFITIDENKGFSLPNDIIAYRPKIELSGTKTLYPLEMEI